MFDSSNLEQVLYTEFKLRIKNMESYSRATYMSDVTYVPQAHAYRFSTCTTPTFIKQSNDDYILDNPSFVSTVPKTFIENALLNGTFPKLMDDITEGIILAVESQ